MVFRVFAAALAAGLLSAVLITGLQGAITTPMILEAETFEAAAPTHDHGAATDPSHADDEQWMPQDGLERTLYTLLANFGAAVGFSLLLIVGLTFDLPQLSAERGVLWGVAGFVVFTLSPALGLAPGLPGLAVPDILAARLWWLGTVVVGGAGLASLIFGQSALIKVLGLVLMVLPHVWGAPQGVGESVVPAELAARFSAASIVLGGVLWIMIGYFSGLIFAHLGKKAES